MTHANLLIAAALAVPLAMLVACLSAPLRDRIQGLLVLAPIPALITAMFAPKGSTLVLPEALLALRFALDESGAMLLGAAALLWMAAAVYAHASLRGDPKGGRFAVWWLMTLTGNLGVFLAADLVGFYLFFTLVSLAAYGLVVFDDTPAAKRAAKVYVALAVLGEAFLLMGFVLLAAGAPNFSLAIGDAVAALATSPWRDPALALLILGFGIKIGLVPFHIWMPLAYSAAPIPAAAVLSGAAVKAGVIGLIRFLPFAAALPDWGEVLAAAGLFSAFFGVAIGLTQTNPKTVLAYSSVSQMGIIAAVLGMGLASGDMSTPGAASFYALHHMLAKGGLFLAVGVVSVSGARDRWLVLLPAAALALGLGGLPLTGGALAKLAVKAPLGDGFVGVLAELAAVGSTLLMIYFLSRLMRSASNDSQRRAPAGLVLPWLTIAIAAVALPWALYPAVAGAPWYDALLPAALWEGLWPVMLGGLLSVGLWRYGRFLPHIPEGDVLAASKGVERAVRAVGAAMERINAQLCQWPVAGVLFLGLTIVLVLTMLTGR